MQTIERSTVGRTQVSTRKHKPLRIFLGIVIAILLLPIAVLVAGFVYQAAASAADARLYPAPGGLVDMGGYSMHLYCTGKRQPGKPTVILAASHPDISSSWFWIQPEVSRVTRTCSFDHLGSGWSSPAVNPPTMNQMAQDLHKVLDLAGEPGPYLLVGHSFGGGVTRMYAADFPDQVSGLVWIEAMHPDTWVRHGLPDSTFGGMSIEMVRGIPAATSVGVFRVFPAMRGAWGYVPGLPDLQQAELTAYFNSRLWADFVVGVEENLPTSLEQLRSVKDLGNLPLAVITGGATTEADPLSLTLQQELARLSTASSVYNIAGADHSGLVHEERYALQVAEIIVEMVEAQR